MQKTGYSCVQCMRQPNCSCRKTPVTSRYKLAHSESGDLYSHDLACGRSVQHVALAREGLLPTEGCNCAVQLYMIQRYQRQLCKAFFYLSARLARAKLYVVVSVFHFQYPTFVLAAGCHLLPRGLRIQLCPAFSKRSVRSGYVRTRFKGTSSHWSSLALLRPWCPGKATIQSWAATNGHSACKHHL